MAKYPVINDKDFDLLKKIAENSAIAAEASVSVEATTSQMSFTGSKLKTDATLVAGTIEILETHITDPVTDNPVNIKSDGVNNAMVVTQNSQPLPTGASTAAKQDTGNASLASIDAAVNGVLDVAGPLTNAELRAVAVPVSGTVTATGPLTDTQLRATPVPVSGTVAATGPLTDTQLRAAPVPVSGTVVISNAVTTQMQVADGPNLDAFSRLRVSNPQNQFDGQFTYNLLPLQYEQIANNGGSGTASIAHNTTDRCALMTFASAIAGAKVYMQSYEHIRYQPGRSQLAFITFNFIEGVANVLKFAGLSDWGSVSAGVGNGIEFQLNSSTKQWTIYSDTGAGDETVIQSNWNLDKLDGNGTSGITLDITKTQIAVIDLQALYVGRVRVGFDINGKVVYCHEFRHANLIANPYIQTASLPVRCGMTSDGTVSTTMKFICSAVLSEGGAEESPGIPFAANGAVTAASGADTHILSVRPKTTFNGIVNRVKFVPESVDLLVTGNSPILWKLVIGQAITGTTTFTDVNATYSAFAFNTAGTASGSPAIVLQQGYVASSSQNKGTTSPKIASRIPITLDAAGAVRANGTMSILVQGIGASSACQATLNWREIR